MADIVAVMSAVVRLPSSAVFVKLYRIMARQVDIVLSPGRVNVTIPASIERFQILPEFGMLGG